MSFEATQEQGGVKSPGVKENVHSKTKSEEVAPGMRGAICRACALLAVVAFVKDLERDASLADGSALGANRGACTSARFHRFCALKGRLVRSVALPIRGSSMGILGRR